MPVGIITHPSSLVHHTPDGHAERIERARTIQAILSKPDFLTTERITAQPVSREQLLRAHTADYLDMIAGAEPAEGADLVQLDPDTWMSAGSLEAASHAAGAACQAVDLVLDRPDLKKIYVGTRPPGHHAERDKAMGFCLYSNAAIAALHALDGRYLNRVAVVDFDVHHGNGTQDVLKSERRAIFCSSHEMPLYPGTGYETERGLMNIFNAPLPAHCDGATFRKTWEEKLLPALDRHAPELIIVSAGFDAHRADPLANCDLGAEDFAWITNRICDLADAHCDGRVVSLQEGGYDLDGLAASVSAHVRTLMERAA